MSNIRSLHGGSSKDVVYFEKQGADGLCGLHCLNNLMQGPLYRVEDVALIGKLLDDEERQLLGGRSDSTFSNVSDNGYFSVTVIEQCLEQTQYRMVPFAHPTLSDLWNDPCKSSDGFICNSRDHWFAIRSVRGRYFRLDSLRPSPEVISNATMRPFLDSLKNSLYSVFAIRHAEWPRVRLPEPEPNTCSRPIVREPRLLDGSGAYLTFECAAKMYEMAGELTVAPVTAESHVWPESAGRVLETSVDGATGSPVLDKDMIDVLKRSAEEFRQTLPDPPPDTGDGIWIKVFDTEGNQSKRRFSNDAKLRDLFLWIHKDSVIMADSIPALAAMNEIHLHANFPKRIYRRYYECGELKVDGKHLGIELEPIVSEFPQGETLHLLP